MATTAPFLTPTQARSRVANLTRSHADPATIVEARRDLAEANIAAAVERALADAPPLTDEQAARLARLLLGAGAAS